MGGAHDEGDLAVPGATLRVVSVGPPGAPALLVAHGGPGEAHEVLRPHFDRLASPRRRVVYWDQRGGGASRLAPGAAPGNWRDHVADIEALRRHLGLARVDLAGFSWGALLAALYGVEHRERVGALVLVSPAPPRSISADEVVAPPPPSSPDELRARFVARVAPALWDPARAADLTPVDTSAAAAAAVWRSLAGVDVASRIASLRGVRALVVCGAADPIAAPGAASLAAGIGASLASLPRCGHAPFVEAPEPFFARVAAFLDGA